MAAISPNYANGQATQIIIQMVMSKFQRHYPGNFLHMGGDFHLNKYSADTIQWKLYQMAQYQTAGQQIATAMAAALIQMVY